jgi:hypothetical protein
MAKHITLHGNWDGSPAECLAWGVGERDELEKKKPAKGRASSRTGKR